MWHRENKTTFAIGEFVLVPNKESNSLVYFKPIGPRQAIWVLIAYASSEGSGEPEHPMRSLAKTSAARSYKQ